MYDEKRRAEKKTFNLDVITSAIPLNTQLICKQSLILFNDKRTVNALCTFSWCSCLSWPYRKYHFDILFRKYHFPTILCSQKHAQQKYLIFQSICSNFFCLCWVSRKQIAWLQCIYYHHCYYWKKRSKNQIKAEESLVTYIAIEPFPNVINLCATI